MASCPLHAIASRKSSPGGLPSRRCHPPRCPRQQGRGSTWAPVPPIPGSGRQPRTLAQFRTPWSLQLHPLPAPSPDPRLMGLCPSLDPPTAKCTGHVRAGLGEIPGQPLCPGLLVHARPLLGSGCCGAALLRCAIPCNYAHGAGEKDGRPAPSGSYFLYKSNDYVPPLPLLIGTGLLGHHYSRGSSEYRTAQKAWVSKEGKDLDCVFRGTSGRLVLWTKAPQFHFCIPRSHQDTR